MSTQKHFPSELTERYTEIFTSQTQDTLVFCDPGIDDALMLAQVLSSKKLNVLGIVPGAGNVSLDKTIANTLRIVELTERTDVKVYPGCKAPIGQSTENMLNGEQVYGEDGLGGIPFKALTTQAQTQDGVEFAANAILTAKKPITLISTGGLTDVYLTLAKIKEINPAALKNIAGISIMGGVFDYKANANAPLHVNPADRVAEFNMIFDPIATKGVFDIAAEAHITILLAPLDLTHTTLYRKEKETKALGEVGNPVATVMADLMMQVPVWYEARFGLADGGMQPAHDVNASMAILHPELYTGRWANVRSVLDGTEVGKTFEVDGGPQNVCILNIPAERNAGFFTAFNTDMKAFDALKEKSHLPSDHKPKTAQDILTLGKGNTSSFAQTL